jgi:DNA polymerase I-like protein with 3'-5' exonuclease and polymerase domains/uracil-DNA glycosylase
MAARLVLLHESIPVPVHWSRSLVGETVAKSLPIYNVFKPEDLEGEEDIEQSPCGECPMRERWGDRGMKCKLAPARRYDIEGTKPDEYDQVDLLVVADAPSVEDNEKGSFWSDDSGKGLLNSIKRLGFKSFVVIPSVRCFPGGQIDHFVMTKQYKGKNGNNFKKRVTPLETAQAAVAHCKGYVSRAINDYNPKITLAMGPLAVTALGMKSNIPNLRVKPIHPKPGLARASRQEGTIVTYDRYMTDKSMSAFRDLKHDLKKVKGMATTGYSTPRGDDRTITIHTLDTTKKVKKFVDWLLTEDFLPDEMICFDFETDGLKLNTQHNRLLNVGFSRRYDEDTSYVIPLAHPQTPFSGEELAYIYKLLKKLFRSKGAKFYGWVAHSAQFETKMIKLFFDTWLGVEGGKPILDTETFTYLLDENRKGPVAHPYRLEELAADFLGFRWYEEQGIKLRRDRLALEPIERVNEYVGMDASVTSRLLNTLIERAAEEGSDEDLLRVSTKLYSKAILYTSDLTLTGQKVNPDLLRKLRAPDSAVVHRLAQIEQEFQKAPEVQQAMKLLHKNTYGSMPAMFKSTTAQSFSLTSQDHRRALFWDVLKLSGADQSVDKDFQAKHKNVPLVALFNEYQGLSKLDSSYLKPIAEWLQSPNSMFDGRLRPSFNLINTATGRLSASDPNSQQMPRGDSDAKKQIKALFMAEIDKLIVQLDFSQAEVRWLGILSGDAALAEKYIRAEQIKEELLRDPGNVALKRALTVDGDIHMDTALRMYKLPRDLPFTDEKAAKLARQKAKTVCFGLIYGKVAKSLAADLKIPVEEAEEAIELWLAQFPQAAEWLHEVERLAEENGYVRSPFGRWRRLPEVASDDVSVVNRAKRQSRNTPIQSAASDTCIYAACKFREALMNSPNPKLREARLVNTVHDSLNGEVPADHDTIREYAQLARSIFSDQNLLMEDFGIKITVPLAIDFDIGVNWGNMRDYDFSEEALNRAIFDAEVMRKQPAGTLWDHLKGKGVLYDEVQKLRAAA